MKTIRTELAALAAALVICLSGSSATEAQTASPPPKPAKQAVKPAKKPAQSAQPAEQTAPPGAQSLCVASLIGHKFDVQTIGIMVIGNALETAATDPWGIDDLTARKITQVMGKQYAVRRLTVPKTVLA